MVQVILDNRSHVSGRPRPGSSQPVGRFSQPSPKHGSWLNLIEGFFSSSPARCCAIRVSKQELKDRIMAAMDFFNQNPVVHPWSYKLNNRLM
jgi:hypothetical protein